MLYKDDGVSKIMKNDNFLEILRSRSIFQILNIIPILIYVHFLIK